MVQWSDERRRQQNELQPGLGLRRSERASLTCRVMNSCRTPVNSELGARSHRVECFKLRRFFSDSSRRVSTPDVSRHTHTIWSLLWNSGCHLAEETKFNENVTLYFLGLKASARSNSKHPHRSGNDCKCHIPSLNLVTKLSDDLTSLQPSERHVSLPPGGFIQPRLTSILLLHCRQLTSAHNSTLRILCDVIHRKVLL